MTMDKFLARYERVNRGFFIWREYSKSDPFVTCESHPRQIFLKYFVRMYG